MKRAEGTFGLDHLDEEVPYDDRERVKLAPAHISKTYACTLDYEL